MAKFLSIPTDRPDDEVLWNSFQSGNRAAFEEIYLRYVRQVINYGLKISRDKNIVQDCTQDLFVELWESREGLSKVTSIKYYLLKSIRYKILACLKNNVSEALIEDQMEMDDNGPELQLLNREAEVIQTQQLLTAISQLPKRQREAIYLRYFQDMNNEEVAQVMGVNYQSACKFIYTALKTMRDIMQLSCLALLLWNW